LQVIDRAAARTIPRVRLVGSDVNEVVSVWDAIEKAEAEGLDLVVVSDQSDPPVVRIQDYKKIQYEKKKAKKAQVKKTSLKEMQFKVNISDHDFQTKLNNIQKFLERGDKVKVSVRLKGRERETPERAHQIIDRVIKEAVCKSSRVPGPIPCALLEPLSTK
jgi:translation initiation factor IF-3